MIDNYKDAEKFLNELRNNDEMLFRMAISHLMDVGIRNLTEENVAYTCAEIRKQDDSHSFMTNEYQCAIVETAAEMAKVNHIALLKYIGKNVKYDI